MISKTTIVSILLAGACCVGADEYITIVDLPDAADFQPADPLPRASVTPPSSTELPADSLDALRASLVELRRETCFNLSWRTIRGNRIRLGCEFASERRDVTIVSAFHNGSTDSGKPGTTYRFSASRTPDSPFSAGESVDTIRFHAPKSYHLVPTSILLGLLATKPGLFTGEEILTALGRPAVRITERRNGMTETHWIYEYDEQLLSDHGLSHRLEFVLSKEGVCLAWTWTASES